MRQGYGDSVSRRDGQQLLGSRQQVTHQQVAIYQGTSQALVPLSSDANSRANAIAAHIAESRAVIARYFLDVRSALQISPQQVAGHLATHPSVIEALETGYVEVLPHWQETSGLVMTYAAWARADGRAILGLIADTQRAVAQYTSIYGAEEAVTAVSAQPASTRFSRASAVLTDHARDMGDGALGRMFARPKRALYAVGFPVCLLIVVLNTSALGSALKPVRQVAGSLGDFFSVQFAPVQDGLRHIEVRDPRSRRGDKLQTRGG